MSNTNKPWNFGKVSEKSAPALHPTTLDIAWAAGIYEGEGYCQHRPKMTTTVRVAQKDEWLCPKLRDLFGGSVRTYRARCKPGSDEFRTYHAWDVFGPRAIGFLMTIYKFLSPRRQAQIRVVLDAVRKA